MKNHNISQSQEDLTEDLMPTSEEEQQLNQEISRLRHEVENCRGEMNALQTGAIKKDLEINRLESDILSLTFKKESWRLRSIESNLKEAIDWYIPVEDILGVPAIGVDYDEFARSLSDREDIIVEPPREPTGNGKQFSLDIYCGPRILFAVLPDNTIRPQKVEAYNKLFSHNPFHKPLNKKDNDSIDIALVGSQIEGHYPDFRFVRFTNEPSNLMHVHVIQWEENAHYPDFTTWTYDINGQLIGNKKPLMANL